MTHLTKISDLIMLMGNGQLLFPLPALYSAFLNDVHKVVLSSSVLVIYWHSLEKNYFLKSLINLRVWQITIL